MTCWAVSELLINVCVCVCARLEEKQSCRQYLIEGWSYQIASDSAASQRLWSSATLTKLGNGWLWRRVRTDGQTDRLRQHVSTEAKGAHVQARGGTHLRVRGRTWWRVISVESTCSSTSSLDNYITYEWPRVGGPQVQTKPRWVNVTRVCG